MKYAISLYLLLSACCLQAQPAHYTDSLQSFRNRYISTHGVIKEKDRDGFQFYAIDKKYYIQATVERIYEAPWFAMETSGKMKKTFRVYAILHFSINGKSVKLSVYQSQQLMSTEDYKDYLFIPFTDPTNGDETYENGRYIDLLTGDLEKETFYIDFNKTYNPYCAYISNVYNCPVPPAENSLTVPVKAGEKKFLKHQ